MDDIQAVALIAMVAKAVDTPTAQLITSDATYVKRARAMLDESRRQVVAARQTDAPPTERNTHVAEPFREILKEMALRGSIMTRGAAS